MLSNIFSKVAEMSFVALTGAIKGIAAPVIASGAKILPSFPDRELNYLARERQEEQHTATGNRRLRDYAGMTVISAAGTFAANAGLNIIPLEAYTVVSATLGAVYNLERNYRKTPL